MSNDFLLARVLALIGAVCFAISFTATFFYDWKVVTVWGLLGVACEFWAHKETKIVRKLRSDDRITRNILRTWPR